jgi:uncharacterized membrane protein YccC
LHHAVENPVGRPFRPSRDDLSMMAVGQTSPSGAAFAAQPRKSIDTIIVAAIPPVLFGLRVWVAVSLALYVAFSLELDRAYWAGTTAAIVCQPSLGASLRKAWFRLLGTAVGAVVVVILTACFVQNRFCFLTALALWGALCGLIASLLRNYAAYGAALAGYTALIIASDELASVGSNPVFMLAVTRASEIAIGIVSAGLVLAGTSKGDAPRRLTQQLVALSREIAGGIGETLQRPSREQSRSSGLRRALLQRVIALDSVLDETIGETPSFLRRLPAWQDLQKDIYVALAGWRLVVAHLERLSDTDNFPPADATLRLVGRSLETAAMQSGEAKNPSAHSDVQAACIAAIQALSSMPVVDRGEQSLLAVCRLLEAVLRYSKPAVRFRARAAGITYRDYDWAPLLNAARVFVTIGVAELIWIATAWPSGPEAIVFAGISVILFSPRADLAYPIAVAYLIGTCLAAVLAAILEFAVLPSVVTFAGFSFALAFILVPAGGLMKHWPQNPIFIAMVANLIPLLMPSNSMIYDPAVFYNTVLAILAGVGLTALFLRLIPPISPQHRADRLLASSLADLRRLAVEPSRSDEWEWETHLYRRLSAFPEGAGRRQRAELLAVVTVGTEIISANRNSRLTVPPVALEAVWKYVALGDIPATTVEIAELDEMLARMPADIVESLPMLRVRGSLMSVSQTLDQYAPVFSRRALQ